MKKFILLSFLGLLVMAFSTSAYAQIEFKASGLIDAQWFYNVNATPANPGAGIYLGQSSNFTWSGGVKGAQLDRTVNYYESRARLKFDAIADKNLSGTLFFELDSATWGDASPTGAQRNAMGYWAADRAAVEVKNVYIDFGLPYIGIPAPMSFRVGLQGFAVRPLLLITTDGMGINWSTKIDPLGINLYWFKPFEGRTAVVQDDVDVLGTQLTAKFGTLTASGYAIFYKMNAYPFPAAVASYGSTGSFKSDMWWFGAYLDGKMGPVNVNFDAIYDWGKVEARPSAYASGIAPPDVDYKGWAVRAKVDYPWDKFNFGVHGYYATGADAEETGPFGLPGSSPGSGLAPFSTKVKSYVIPPGSEAGAAFGESVVFYSFWGNRGDSGIANSLNYTQMCRGPMGGTWMAKAYASMKAAPWYKITLQGMYIGDTTENGNTFGTARSSLINLQDKSDIGWELDLINEISIYKNLQLTVAGGYLWAGKAMDQYTGTTILGAPVNNSIKNPWALMWNLTYNF